MLKKVMDYIKKNNIIMYLLLGVLTTAANFVVYFPLYNLLGVCATVSNILSWAVSVIVAFVTNKPFVFKSTDWSASVTLPEFIKFVGCRLLSGVIETLFMGLSVDIFRWNGNIMKIIVSVFVVIANYIFSKLIVFRKKN